MNASDLMIHALHQKMDYQTQICKLQQPQTVLRPVREAVLLKHNGEMK
jgi:hypothetical protein